MKLRILPLLALLLIVAVIGTAFFVRTIPGVKTEPPREAATPPALDILDAVPTPNANVPQTPAPAAPAGAAKPFIAWTGRTSGVPLVMRDARTNDGLTPGREWELAMPNLASFSPGDLIEVAIPDGRKLTATVNLSREDMPTTWVLAAGFGNDLGGLTLRQDKDRKAIFGRIVRVNEAVAYTVTTDDKGGVWATECWRDEILPSCAPPMNPPSVGNGVQGAPPGPASGPPPVFDSKPDAVAVLYVDFDGEVATTYPDWPVANPGAVSFSCTESDLTLSQMTDVLRIIAEDYAPFNITVTTELNRYTAPAAAGKRMRCIVSPTDTGDPGGAGRAWTQSFRPGTLRQSQPGEPSGGIVVANNVPCWVPTNGYTGANRHRVIADAVAHEFGHTLGLSHDGPGFNGYYPGHGTGPNDWAPLMGNYRGSDDAGRNIVQWSKGEYATANNLEDDVAIIASAANGFNYREDESASIITATPITLNGSQAGIISSAGDYDYFAIDTVGAGVVNLTVTSGVAGTPQARNLDVGLQLLNSIGDPIVTSTPGDSMDATVTTNVPAGRYYLQVFGTSYLTASTGYTDYGSLGAYSISGSLPPPPDTELPTIAVTRPGHNSIIKEFTEIGGTASDGSGGGISGNAVTFTMFHVNTGKYWDGVSAWSDAPVLLTAPFNAVDGTWSWVGPLPSAATATLREGQHLISARARDTSDNLSLQQPGVNQTSFHFDSVPPTVSITTPPDASTISSLPSVSGLAGDGAVTVKLYLLRRSDNKFWDGSSWGGGAPAILPTLVTGPSWNNTTPPSLPAPGSDANVNLTDGSYDIIAIAVDAAGNEQRTDSNVTVELVYTWTGATLRDTNPNNNSSLWDTAANWNYNSVPGPGDMVQIDNGDAVTSTVDRTVRGLRLGGESTSLGEFSVTVTGGAGTSVWSNGMINGTLNVASGGYLTIDTTLIPVLYFATLVNEGTVLVIGDPLVNSGGRLQGRDSTFSNPGALIINRSGLVFENIGNMPAIHNTGTLSKIDGGVSTVGWAMNNNGRVEAISGTLAFSAGSTALGGNGVFHAAGAGERVEFSGGTHVIKTGARFTGPGRGRVSGGTLTLDGAAEIGNVGTPAGGFELTGNSNLAGVGSLTMLGGGGTFAWSGGFVSTTVTVGAGAQLALDTTALPVLYFGTFNLAGSGVITGTPASRLQGRDSVFNLSGSLAINRNGLVFENIGNMPTIHNTGTLSKIDGGLSTVGWAMNNNGRVEAISGTLAFSAGSTALGGNGVFHAAGAGERVEFSGGTHILKAGARFTGPGRGRLSAGTLTLDGAAEIGNVGTPAGGFELTGNSNLAGVGSLTMLGGGGTFAWSGGFVSTTVTVGAGALLALDTTALPVLYFGTFNLAGSGVITGTSASRLQGRDSVFNLSGSLAINRNGLVFENIGNMPAIHNTGTLSKIDGGVSTVGWAMNNNGRVEAISGTLAFSAGSTALGGNGVFHAAGAGERVEFSGGTHILKAGARFTGPGRGRLSAGTLTVSGAAEIGDIGAPAGGFELTANSTLNGTGSLATIGGGGTFAWSGGIVSTTVTVGVGAQLALNTTALPVLYFGTFNLAGSGVITGDPASRLQGRGSIFNNSGTLSINRGGLVFENIGEIPTLHNSGTLVIGNPLANVSMNWNFTQTASGVLDLQLGGTNAATPQFDQLKVQATATLGGKLRVSHVNGFEPALGNNFPVMAFNTRAGDFATHEGLGLGNGLALSPVLAATSLTLTTVQSGFGAWQVLKFGVDANNPLIAGPFANPDSDLANNALEYAFNLNPLLADTAGSMPVESLLTDSGTGFKHLAITYRRRITGTDPIYTVRVANNLSGVWDETGLQLEQVGLPVGTGDGITERVTMRLIAPVQGANRKFLQIKVTVN